MDKYLLDMTTGEPLYSAKHYDVMIVKMPDMPTSTYAIVNKQTGIMEQLHPTLFGSRRMADIFSEAEDGKGTGDDEMDLLEGIEGPSH